MHTGIIHGEPNLVYHANKAIGSGKLRAFIRSPALFRDHLDGLCSGESDALLFGIASHLRLLEPELFAKTCVIKPDGLSFASKEGKAWRDAHEGFDIVPFESARHLERMHERMPKEVRDIFQYCRKEVTVRTEVNGIAIQCRPDLWNIDGLAKYDLKTIGNIEAIDGAIWKHGYHIQDRWYRYVIAAAGAPVPKESKFIFVEKLPPYRWRIVDLDYDYQTLADTQIAVAMAGISERMKSGNWSDGEDLHHIASPPEYATEHLTTEDEE